MRSKISCEFTYTYCTVFVVLLLNQFMQVPNEKFWSEKIARFDFKKFIVEILLFIRVHKLDTYLLY